MGKFEINSRVIFELDGIPQRGRITGTLAKRRKVVTDSGKRVEVPLGRLRRSLDRVLLLETRLDRSLKSNRQYGRVMQQWLFAYDVEVLYERVHTIESLRKFLGQEGKNIHTRFVHIMCHGSDKPGNGRAEIELTFDQLDLLQQADVFKGLDGKIIIFSCCEIGADIKALQMIKKVSKASGIIAYRKWVYDSETNLCEALLYDRLIQTNWSPHKVVTAVSSALKTLGVQIGPAKSKKPVLVCV